MKKVIEQGKGYLGVQYLTETISVYQRFGLNPNGVFILIDKPKAREVALAICPELESELAEKDKEIERYAIEFAEWFIKNTGKYTDDILALRQGKYIELYNQSLNK